MNESNAERQGTHNDPARPRRGCERDSFLFTDQAADTRRPAIVPRVFVREPGWRAHIKTDSDRLFCFAIAPDEAGHHRISDGELYVQRGDERLCIPCADRMGLIHYSPKALREGARGVLQTRQTEDAEYPLAVENG